MIQALPMKRGPKRKDTLLARLEAVPVKGEILLDNENQRNRALKFGRETRRFFVTRSFNGKILLWRAT